MPDTTDLLKAARKVRRNAYAPYSEFAVGAAVRDEHDRIHTGVNVENAAYPSGSCAEQSAIARMVACGGRRIQDILVVADSDSPVTPCGACRQRIREFATAETRVYMANRNDTITAMPFEELLPLSFGPEVLP